MEELYTVNFQQQSKLSDLYYMSCVASLDGQHNEMPLSKSLGALVIAVSMAQGLSSYMAPVNTTMDLGYSKIESVYSLGNNWSSPGKINSVKEGNFIIEVTQSPTFNKKNARESEMDLTRINSARRVDMLKASYKKNTRVSNLSFPSFWMMQIVNNALSSLPFIDAILQYDQFDDVWQYNLYFEKDLELTVSAYVDEGQLGDVDFNIFHNGELIVANTMPLSVIVEKMKSILTKVGENV